MKSIPMLSRPAPAKHSHRRPAALDRFHFGVAFYPEHWPEEMLAEDIRRLRVAGVNTVRMAEFAWTLIEPRPGDFRFDFFDRVISALGEAGIQTILCTPTAAPPRWLSFAHPEILRVNAEGIRFEHGGRVHASYSSPVYRDYSRRITRAMAEHFRNHPHVVGWQTDNEFLCGFTDDHSEAAQANFCGWLRHRYDGDIDALNEAWGNAFWSQTYGSFDEIPTPLARPAGPSQSHRLEFGRFLSDEIVVFQGEQVAILREANPGWWITHNGCFPGLDYRGEFGRQLDVLGYDSYPFFNQSPQQRPASHAFNLDRVRAWTGNFLVLESQAGAGSGPWRTTETPEPGELRRLAYTALARGADGLFLFNWRTCSFGHEIHWQGVLDADNQPRRRYREFCQLGEEISRVGVALRGTSVVVQVAVAASDNDEALGDQAYPLTLPGPQKMAEGVHQWFFQAGYAVGCIHPTDDLRGVPVYVLPHWPIIHPDWVVPLERYVADGGTLVIGARSGTRDWTNRAVTDTFPGLLRTLAGVRVEEYGIRNTPEERPLELDFADASIPAGVWYEQLLPDADTEVVARWRGRHLTDEAAITCRRHGAGRVYYVGSNLEGALLEVLLPRVIAGAGLQRILPGLPPRIEAVCRENATRRLWFLINHNETATPIPEAPSGHDLVTDRGVNDGLTLPPNGVAVIETTR